MKGPSPEQILHYGPRFADYVVADAKFATAPFLHAADQVHPHAVFAVDGDLVEVWDAEDFAPWETLQGQSVGVLRYRQHKPNGAIIEAYWHTDFSLREAGSLSLFRIAKSRWEIENQGFHEAKNLHGMEPIAHHEPNSRLLGWLLLPLVMLLERLYRVRYLHRGDHALRSAIDLCFWLWINLGCTPRHDSS